MAEEHSGRSALASIMNAVAEWARLCRTALGAPDGLVQSLRAESVRGAFAAHTAALVESARGVPQSAMLLRRMLIALGLDPDAPALNDHAASGELERACAACEHKPECAEDLAKEAAAEHSTGIAPTPRRSIRSMSR